MLHPVDQNMQSEQKSRVNLVHSEGEHPSPMECIESTLRVNEEHLKSTNKSIKEYQHQKLKKESRERKVFQKDISEKDIETVIRTFRSKGVQVTDKMIDDLLRQYNIKAVQAAIQSTDFNVARNPLAVIRWMLANGTYLMPLDKETAPAAQEQMPEPVDDELVRQMIKDTRESLNKKTLLQA